MGPSLFRQLSEHTSRSDIAGRPSNSVGWLVSTNELIGKEIGTNEYLASLSNMSIANLQTVGNSLRSMSTRNDSASVIVPATAGLTAKKLVSPKPQGHLISGPDGQLTSLVPPGKGKIGLGFLSASGDNVQTPSIGGVLIQDLPSTTINTEGSAEIQRQATTNPSPEGGSETEDGRAISEPRGSPHKGKSAPLIEALLNSIKGNTSNTHLPRDIDPKTGEERDVSNSDGASFYGTNTRTGTAYRTLSDLKKDFFKPTRHDQMPFSVPGIGGTVRIGK